MIFENKNELQPDRMPDKILCREKQTKYVMEVLALSLVTEKPDNILIFGRHGTGKTCVIKHATQQIGEFAKKNNLNLKTVYFNCEPQKKTSTTHRLLEQLILELGKEVFIRRVRSVYNAFIRLLEEQKTIIILVLDKIDELSIEEAERTFHMLKSLSSKLHKSKILIIGISVDLSLIRYLDPRLRIFSEEISFPPYNTLELLQILQEKASASFKKRALEEEAIETCAALTAKEHGDARKALELLSTAGELAEKKKHKKVWIKDVYDAEEKISIDSILKTVKNTPKQFQLVLYSILQLNKNKKYEIFTGGVYETYKQTARRFGQKPVTQTVMSSIITELDMLGLIFSKIISKGRYGRTKEISIDLPETTIKKIIKSLELSLNTKIK